MRKRIARFGMTKELMTFGIGMIVLVIALAYGLDITTDVQTDFATDSCAARGDSYTVYNATQQQCQNSTGALADVDDAAFNATVDGVDGVGNISSQLPTIATIAMAVVIIGLVVGMMYIRRG